jgi:formiminotetrahydrofolate cyclodeaminase
MCLLGFIAIQLTRMLFPVTRKKKKKEKEKKEKIHSLKISNNTFIGAKTLVEEMVEIFIFLFYFFFYRRISVGIIIIIIIFL